MGGYAVNGPLQLEAFRPLREVCPRALHAVVELVGGGVAADLPRPEAVGGLEVLRFYVLVVDCALPAVLIVVVRVGVRPRHFEDFVLGPRLLVAGAPSLGQIGLVVLEQVAKGHFELLLELFLLRLDQRGFGGPVDEVLRTERG